MISHYRLKQNGCFRAFYRWPYFIKNLFLLALEAFLLMLIYLIFFRSDGGNINNAIKILKGLNSNTFNYLESNKEKLNIGKLVPMFHSGMEYYGNSKKITPQKFYGECLRYNRPCVVNGLAKSWPAFIKWKTEENLESVEYMKTMIGQEQLVNSYQQSSETGPVHNHLYSFRLDWQK